MPLALLTSIGSTELLVLGFAALFQFSMIALMVSVIRSSRRRADRDRTIATLVEENRRLRKALGERPDEMG